jgi:hypothetical protein
VGVNRRTFLRSVTALPVVGVIRGDLDLESKIIETVDDGYRITAPEIAGELWGPFESRRREIRYNTRIRRKLRQMEQRGLVERKPITDYPGPLRLAPVWRVA